MIREISGFNLKSAPLSLGQPIDDTEFRTLQYGVIATIATVVSKYRDRSPPYRQAAVLEREAGLEIGRATWRVANGNGRGATTGGRSNKGMAHALSAQNDRVQDRVRMDDPARNGHHFLQTELVHHGMSRPNRRFAALIPQSAIESGKQSRIKRDSIPSSSCGHTWPPSNSSTSALTPAPINRASSSRNFSLP